MFEIMFCPLLALVCLALIAGAYGSQMMWHKVACLGDTMSHGALLGLAVGLLFGFNENVSLLLLSAFWGLFLWLLTKSRQNTTDTIMAFLMQTSMALAILFFTFSGQDSEMMHAFLGDVLMTDKKDVLFILGTDLIFGIILFFCWKKWVLIAISPDLAKSQKININLQQIIFFASSGFLVAQTMLFTGALLAPAFFVIPAMTARLLSKTPEQMAFGATIFALLSSCIGILFSFYFDLPTGCCVVLCCVICYVCVVFCGVIKTLLNKYRAYCKDI